MRNKTLYVGWLVIILLVIGISVGFIIGKTKGNNEGESVYSEQQKVGDVVLDESVLVPHYVVDEEDNIVLPESTEDPVIEHTPNIQVGTIDNEASSSDWAPDLIEKISPSFQSVANPIPMQLYIMSVEEIGDGVKEVIVGCRNTDVVCIAYTTDYSTWDFLECGNQYGSDFAIVYWYNDVPENSEYWYDMLFESGLYGGPYTADYSGGDTCIFVDSTTGEQFMLVGGEE